MPPLDGDKYIGVPDDPRHDPRVVDGWRVDELLPGDAPINWQKKDELAIAKYPVWSQGGSSACVAYSKARQVSIRVKKLTGQWLDYSPASIYQLRSTEGEGMNIADANDIVNKRGVAIEAYMKSFGLNEVKINAVPRSPVAELSSKAMAEAVMRYFYVPVDIDRIAQVLEGGKAVALLLFSTEQEYARKQPVLIEPNLTYEIASIRHEVVAVDYYLDVNGVKKLRVEDSAHFGSFSTRDFTEQFLESRVIMADAIDVFSLSFVPPTLNIKPVFSGSIRSLQECLKWEGLLAKDVELVENLGPKTIEAMKKFQVKYGLHPTGVPSLGPLTRQKLFELYPIRLPDTGIGDEVPKIPYSGVNLISN